MELVTQQWYTVADAATYLGRTRRAIEALLAKGELKSTLVLGRRSIHISALEAVAPPPPAAQVAA